MGMKKHAIRQTSLVLERTAEAYKQNPCATNFNVHHDAMLAHQVANTHSEQDITKLLAGKTTPQIVPTLASYAEKSMNDLHLEVLTGVANVYIPINR